MSQINQFDLAFIVDTTGSMGGLIASAQRRMIGMVDRLAAAAEVDMQLGVVEYRDHPPQDRMVCRVYPMTGDLRRAKETISRLKADGGGDAPEAVLAGVVAACTELAWRRHSRRIAVLVGDAPPHGVGCPGDAFPRACPSGETVETVSAKAEQARVTVYALGLQPACEESFRRISGLTGGCCFSPVDPIDQIEGILVREFGQLDFDRRVYDAWRAADAPSIDLIADQIATTPPRVASAVSRLQSRGLLTVWHNDRCPLNAEDRR